MYCKIRSCRFPGSHVSLAHKCGDCGQFGHGLIECKNSNSRRKLLDDIQFYPAYLPQNISCQVADCATYWQHTSQSHHCSLCGDRHEEFKCNSLTKKCDGKVICPLCKLENSVDVNADRIFGISETCKVCLYAEVEILLPGCKHACLCRQCFNTMKI